MKELKVFFKNSKGLKICGILEEPDPNKEKIVIIVHGYHSNKDRTSAKQMSEELTKRKINSLRIDLDGCGESEGKFEEQTISSAADDISAAISFVKERKYFKINLFGASAGGLAIMATALKHKDTDRIGLKAPPSDYPSQCLRKMGAEKIKEWREAGYTYRITGDGNKVKVNYSFLADAKKHVMYNKVKGIKCPVLIIHGDKDDMVLVEQSKKVITSFPKGKLTVLEGADHALEINGDRTKSNKLFGDWFEK